MFFIYFQFIFGIFCAFGNVQYKENKGQWPSHVLFCSEFSNGRVFLEKNGFTWQLYNEKVLASDHLNLRSQLFSERKGDPNAFLSHVFRTELIDADFKSPVKSLKQPGYENYFLGNNPAHWASGVNAYGKLYFHSVYPNIDMEFNGSGGHLKYDIIVKPGGDLNKVVFHYKYTNGIELTNGNLLIKTAAGDVLESIPEAYQLVNNRKVKVKCAYKLKDDNKAIIEVLSNWDSTRDLIIDPVVVVSSFSGTETVSFGLGLAPDSKGNMYLSSMSLTKDYPVTFGVIQSAYAGGPYDNVVSKFNASGTAKLFSTYIGGNKDEIIINCFVQGNELAVFGATNSDTFPVIKNGFQTKIGGKSDYFLIKLDTSGKNLIASTYIGGQRSEAFSGLGSQTWYYPQNNNFGEMIMDKWNNCYIIGSSISFDYPTTQGSYRQYSDSNGFSDLVITKVKSDLTQLHWSTFYGGNHNNSPFGIRLSRSGLVYGAATTSSKNFPTTPGVVHSSSVATMDMAAFALDTLNGFPVHSSYIGARNTEGVRFDMDQQDQLYLIGNSLSPHLTTVTPGAYNVNTGSVFFYKISPAISQINTIARFGYPNTLQNIIEIDAFNIDSCGYIYFGGFGLPGLPVTPDAFKSIGNASGSLYLGVFNPNFTSLKFGTYYGPNNASFNDHDDGGLNYFDDRGYFYHALCVDKSWPVTPGAYSGHAIKDSLKSGSVYLKNSDAFIKIDLQTFVNANSSLGGVLKSCSPITATFATNPNLGSVTIIPGDGSPAVNTNTLVHSYNAFGTYTALVVAGADSSTCNIIDSIKILVKYGPQPVRSLKDKSISCNGNVLLLDAGNNGASYLWNTGETSQTIKPNATGTYWVKIENDFCDITDSTYATVEDSQSFTLPNAFTPNGDGQNDMFCLKGWKHCNESFSVIIFNRWGEKVFESENPDFCWDGMLRGKPLSSDVYAYHISASYQGETVIQKKGNITLIR